MKTLVIAIIPFLLLMAGAASAQTELAATYLEVTTEAPLEEGAEWDGSSVSARVDVELCSDQEGGFNPSGGSVLIEAAVSAPAWVEVQVSPETIELAPGTGPEPEPPGCMDSGSFTIDLSSDEPEPGQSVSIDVTLSVAEGEGEEEEVPVPAPAMGTYAPPSDESTGFSLQTAAAAQEDDDEDDDAGQTGGGGTDTGESPFPGFVAVSVLTAAWTALVRRRRERR